MIECSEVERWYSMSVDARLDVLKTIVNDTLEEWGMDPVDTHWGISDMDNWGEYDPDTSSVAIHPAFLGDVDSEHIHKRLRLVDFDLDEAIITAIHEAKHATEDQLGMLPLYSDPEQEKFLHGDVEDTAQYEAKEFFLGCSSQPNST